MYRQIAELDDILIDPSFSIEDNGLPTTATHGTELTNNDDTYGGEEQFEDYTEDFDENSPLKKQASVLLSEGEESAVLEDSFVDANPANMYRNTAPAPAQAPAPQEEEGSFVDANPANMYKTTEPPRPPSMGNLFPVVEVSRETSPQDGNNEPEPRAIEHVQVPTPRSLNDGEDNIMHVKNRRLGVTSEQLRKLKQFEPLLAHELHPPSKGRAQSFDTGSSSRVNQSSTAPAPAAAPRPSAGPSFSTVSSQPQDSSTIPPPPRSAIIQPSYLNFNGVTSGSGLPNDEVQFSRTFHHSAPPLSDNWQGVAAKSAALQNIARPNTDDAAMMRAVCDLMSTAKQHTRQNNSEGYQRFEDIAEELHELIKSERRKLKQSQADRLQEQETALLALLKARAVPPTYHYNQQVVLLSEYLRNRHQEVDANAGHCIFLIDSKNRSTPCSDSDLRDSLNSVSGTHPLTACNSKRSGAFVHRYNHCLVTVVTISMQYSHNLNKKPAPKVIFLCGPNTVPPLNTSRIKGPNAKGSNVSSIILKLFNASGNANNQYDPDNVEFNKQIEILYHSVFPRQEDPLCDADIQRLLALQQKNGVKVNRKESNEKISRYEQLLLEIEELIRLQKQKQTKEDGVIDRLFYLSQAATRRKKSTSPLRPAASSSIPTPAANRRPQSPGRRSCEACNLRQSQQSDGNTKPPFYTSHFYSNHHTYQPHTRNSLGGTAGSSTLRGSSDRPFAPRASASEPVRQSSRSQLNRGGGRGGRGSAANYDSLRGGDTMNLVLDGSPLDEEEGERETVKVDKDDYYRYLLTRLQVTQPNVTLSCDKIYTNFLSDMIDVCKRRSHECDSAEEVAMHRALSGYVAESFAASSIDRIRAGMVRSALELQRNELDD